MLAYNLLHKALYISMLLTALNLNAQVEFLVTVDEQTGVHTKIDSIEGVKWITVAPDFTFIDEKNELFVFRGGDKDFNWALYSVDIHTGNILAAPSIPILEDPQDNLIGLQIDHSTGKLFALHWDASEMQEYLVTVNRETGVHSIVAPIPGVEFIAGGSMYDSQNSRYIFIGIEAGITYIYTLSTADGNLEYKTLFPQLDEEDNIINMNYDNVSGKLIGLHWDASEQQEYLVSVSLDESEVHIIKEIPGVKYIGYAFYDQSKRRYMMLGSADGTNQSLMTLDVESGDLLHQTDFPVDLDPSDNVINMVMNNTTNTIYGLHWDAELLLSSSENIADKTIEVFPNPMFDKAEIKLNGIYDHLQFSLYDNNGRKLKSFDSYNTEKVSFTRDGLTTGLYFLKISHGENSTVHKIMIR